MPGVGQGHPSAVAVGERVFVTWRSEAILASARAEDVWLKAIEWQTGQPDVGDILASPEVPLPRQLGHTYGDQRWPAFAATPLAPEGALATAWEDYGNVFGESEGNPDTVVALIPVPALFSPGDLGPSVWVRGDEGVTLSSLGRVSTWADQSGHRRDYSTAASSAEPAFSASGIGGRPSLDYDGALNHLDGPDLVTVIAPSASTVFAVCRVDSVATNESDSWSNPHVWQGNLSTGIHFKSAGPTALGYNSDLTDDHADQAFSLASPMLLTMRHGAGALGLAKDGGAFSSVSSGDTVNLDGVTTIGSSNASAPYDGLVSEILVYDRALSDADRAQVDAYLMSRYGL